MVQPFFYAYFWSMKFLYLGVLLFFAYRLFLKPMIDGPKTNSNIGEESSEFSEYEEIE